MYINICKMTDKIVEEACKHWLNCDVAGHK